MDSQRLGRFNRPIFDLDQAWRANPVSQLRVTTGCQAHFAGQLVAYPFPPQRATGVTLDHSWRKDAHDAWSSHSRRERRSSR